MKAAMLAGCVHANSSLRVMDFSFIDFKAGGKRIACLE